MTRNHEATLAIFGRPDLVSLANTTRCERTSARVALAKDWFRQRRARADKNLMLAQRSLQVGRSVAYEPAGTRWPTVAPLSFKLALLVSQAHTQQMK